MEIRFTFFFFSVVFSSGFAGVSLFVTSSNVGTSRPSEEGAFSSCNNISSAGTFGDCHQLLSSSTLKLPSFCNVHGTSTSFSFAFVLDGVEIVILSFLGTGDLLLESDFKLLVSSTEAVEDVPNDPSLSNGYSDDNLLGLCFNDGCGLLVVLCCIVCCIHRYRYVFMSVMFCRESVTRKLAVNVWATRDFLKRKCTGSLVDEYLPQ